MSKYTPGPWEIQECYDGKYEITSPAETLEETRLIGIIEPACNIKNDARLIAAAPELLEITKKLWRKCCRSFSTWIRCHGICLPNG